MGSRLHVTGGVFDGGRGIDGEAAIAGTFVILVSAHYR